MAVLRVRRLSALAVAAALLFAVAACQTNTGTNYVALGDSYTAGPLIPDQSLSPLGCLRSDHNYPSLIAPTLGLSGSFTDVSCSGAETNEMFNPQNVTPGPANPAQLTAIDANTKVVTIGIGGNDIGFSSIVEGCINLNPFATPCQNQFASPSGDILAQRIAATAPKIAAVLQGAHQRNASAKVFLIGYPDILPPTTGCWPALPILPADIPYLYNVEIELNHMLATVAAANGATYVDLYPGTAAHNACSSDPWIEKVIPDSSAAPAHPNANGMIGEANIIGPFVKAHI